MLGRVIILHAYHVWVLVVSLRVEGSHVSQRAVHIECVVDLSRVLAAPNDLLIARLLRDSFTGCSFSLINDLYVVGTYII